MSDTDSDDDLMKLEPSGLSQSSVLSSLITPSPNKRSTPQKDDHDQQVTNPDTDDRARMLKRGEYSAFVFRNKRLRGYG
jgi:hypothetical protein